MTCFLACGLMTISCVALKPTEAQAPSATTATADAPSNVTFHVAYGGAEGDPVKIMHVMVGGREVPLDAPVAVNGRWLRTVDVIVENVSSKPIVQGSVVLSFADTGDGSPEKPTMSSYLSLGRHPSSYFLHRDGTTGDPSSEKRFPEIEIQPGQLMHFKHEDFGDGTNGPRGGTKGSGDVIQDEVEKNVAQITRVNIMLGRYYFNDGGGWLAGKYYLPAPRPELWKLVTPAQFFARSPQN